MDKKKPSISTRLKSSQPGAWKRVGKVVLATLGGLAIAYIISYALFFHGEGRFCCFLEIIQEIVDSESKGRFQLFILITGLPVFLALWAFRTYDKNNQLLFEAIGLLGDDSTKRLALVKLAFLRNKKRVFVNEIDQITQGADLGSHTKDAKGNTKILMLSDLDLQSMNFKYANFSHSHLRRTNFQKTDLTSAFLAQTDLVYTDFKGADLKETNLGNSVVCGADFREAKNLNPSKLEGAYYDNHTKGLTEEQKLTMKKAGLE